LLASLLGAGLTLGILRLRKLPLPESWAGKPWIGRLYDRSNGVPYGVALAVAGLIIYPDTPLWHIIVGV
jgi:prepilin peptidase CpaA